jgi:putative hydrolase of the HAD superfamily
MIKVVVFDADGVVITGTTRLSERLEKEYGISKEMTAPFFTGKFQDCLVGKADLKEEITKFLPEWGWKGTLEGFLKVWFEGEHAISEPIIEEVHKLKSRGIRCFIATNNEKYRTEYITKDMGFGDIFEYVFSSGNVGHLKHDVAHFEHIMQKIGPIDPGEILFWDDDEKNVATARKAGWNAEFYDSFEAFQKKMEQYLAQNA